ncbi:MAG: DUF4296 domain-containing protein [Bacteroidaceae bacterium]|nr:DUF4296 domain-containing protein [Bacteroidaceae bacterium]
MEDILVDYHLAQGIYEVQGGGEEARYKLLHAVFAKHQITEAEFDSSLLWYGAHSEHLMEIYERVDKRIETHVSQCSNTTEVSQSKYAMLGSDGDTCNVWTFTTFTNLFSPYNKIFRFSLAADSTYRKGDHFLWHLCADFVAQAGANEAFAQLVVTYENDSVLSTTKYIQSKGEFELTMSPSSSMDTLGVKTIDGFVYYPDAKGDEQKKFRIMMLSDMALIRMHKMEVPVTNAEEPAVADTLATCSSDSSDTSFDSIPHDVPRRTPKEVREAKPHISTIDVQKVRPVLPTRNRNKKGRR